MVEIAPGTTVQIVQPGLVVPLGVVKGDKGDPGAPGGSDASFASFINDTTPSQTRAALTGGFGRVFGVDGDTYGGGTTDATAHIQARIDTAAAAGGGTVQFPAGTYACSGLALKSGVRLVGNGATLRKNGGAAGTNVITATGTLGTSTALAANVARSANSLSVTSATGFAVGDYVLVRDATYKYGTSGRNQEIARIAGISGATVTLTSGLIGGYATASTAEMLKLTPVKSASVEGLTIDIPAGQNGGGIKTILAVGITVRGCTISGFSDEAGISFQQSARCQATLNTIRDGVNTSTSGYGYGLQVAASSHGCTLGPGNLVENVRECMFTDNARNSSFVGNTVVGPVASGVNTHGSGCENILIQNNVITGGAGVGIAVGHLTDNTADLNVTISGNTISAIAGGGINVTAGSSSTARRHKGVVIQGNSVQNVGLTVAGSFAISAKYADHVIITGNMIDGTAATIAVHGINVDKCEYGATVANNTIRNLQGRGITLSGVTTEPVFCSGNRMYAVASYQFIVNSTVTVTPPAVLLGNLTNTVGNSLLGTEVLIGNRFGGAWTAPAVTGSRGGNAALASLLTVLKTSGVVDDQTTA